MTIILEKSEDGYFAWLEDCPEEFSGINTFGINEAEVVANVRMLMKSFLADDFANEPKFVGFNPDMVIFSFRYSLIDFFDTYKALKINSIAELAGLNKSLVRQYATGAATASSAQVQKIQEAVRSLAQSLLHVSIA
jgi:hypothetical protein